MDDSRLRAHECEQMGHNVSPDRSAHNGREQPEGHRLDRGLGRAVRVVSPMRRATKAVAPTPKPAATAYKMAIIDSVSPTVAIAPAPSRPTKNTSVTANTLSSAISNTIGTASSRIARRTDPCVKSCCDPRSDSPTMDQKRALDMRAPIVSPRSATLLSMVTGNSECGKVSGRALLRMHKSRNREVALRAARNAPVRGTWSAGRRSPTRERVVCPLPRGGTGEAVPSSAG